MKIKLLLVLLCAQAVYSLNPEPPRRPGLERPFFGGNGTITLLGVMSVVGGHILQNYRRSFLSLTFADRRTGDLVRITSLGRTQDF